MGIDARMVVYAESQSVAEIACTDAFNRIAEIEQVASDYRRTSEAMQFCDRAGTGPIRVSPDLFALVTHSRVAGAATGGAFDTTVGRLVQLWRTARHTGVLPRDDEIRSAMEVTGWQKIRAHEGSKASLTKAGVRLDFGGIAKGYAADEAQKVLKRHGISRALVELGGDLVVTDPPPGTSGWTVKVPNATADGVGLDFEFTNCAISTSGDTEQSTSIGGVRYSHVVDPRSGWALTSRTQATVVAPTGTLADPLSTALTVLGESGRQELLDKFPGVRAYVRTISTRA